MSVRAWCVYKKARHGDKVLWLKLIGVLAYCVFSLKFSGWSVKICRAQWEQWAALAEVIKSRALCVEWLWLWVSDWISSGRRYPLRHLPKAIKELFSDLLGHAGHHRAQGEDNKAVVSWALHKLFQVLRGGGKRHTNATQKHCIQDRGTKLSSPKTFFRAFSTHGPVFPLLLAKLFFFFPGSNFTHTESLRGAEKSQSFTMLWASSWKSLHNVKTISRTSNIYLHSSVL